MGNAFRADVRGYEAARLVDGGYEHLLDATTVLMHHGMLFGAPRTSIRYMEGTRSRY